MYNDLAVIVLLRKRIYISLLKTVSVLQGMRYGVGIIEFLNAKLLKDVNKPIQLSEVCYLINYDCLAHVVL